MKTPSILLGTYCFEKMTEEERENIITIYFPRINHEGLVIQMQGQTKLGACIWKMFWVCNSENEKC